MIPEQLFENMLQCFVGKGFRMYFLSTQNKKEAAVLQPLSLLLMNRPDKIFLVHCRFFYLLGSYIDPGLWLNRFFSF